MPQITPEIQAQLDEQKKQCIFCKIIKEEIPSQKVYEDNLMVAILDINPASKGHLLVMPKEHYPIMPFIPPKTFTHMFGRLPKLIKAQKQSIAATGINVLIANGGIAGQQSPHFLFHLIPRESQDGVSKFFFEEKSLDVEKNKAFNNIIKKNLPLMLSNNFQRNPQPWHVGKVKTAQFLAPLKIGNPAIYEDEKVLVLNPKVPQCVGHVEIFSQEEEAMAENLSSEGSNHLFTVASFAATAVFEGLGAQGSNILLKSGISDDNQEGTLSVHVFPRSENDGLNFQNAPMSEKPDPEQIKKQMRNEMILIEQSGNEKPREIISLDEELDEKETDSKKNEFNAINTKQESEERRRTSEEKEIMLAINLLRQKK